jgi:DNA-damage-inducible protein J
MLTADIRFKVEPDLKRDATAILKACGFDVSTAMRLFLHSVVEKGRIPEMLLEQLDDAVLTQLVKTRRGGKTVKVSLDDL